MTTHSNPARQQALRARKDAVAAIREIARAHQLAGNEDLANRVERAANEVARPDRWPEGNPVPEVAVGDVCVFAGDPENTWRVTEARKGGWFVVVRQDGLTEHVTRKQIAMWVEARY